MRPLFFTDVVGHKIVLSGDEGHHAADVSRVRLDEEIDVSDGKRWVHARVTHVSKGHVEADVVNELPIPQLTPHLTVAQALIKGDAMGESIDLMTQVGVHEIIPWVAERSIVQWDATKADKNHQKLQAVALEASKQARRPIPPNVKAVMETKELLTLLSEYDRVVLLHEAGEDHLADIHFGNEKVLMIVGPEGGLSDQELSQFTGAILRLGPTVIRSAQAGAIAAAVAFASSGWRKS